MKRAINCPGSVAASRGISSPDSEYSTEGTACHDTAANILLGDKKSPSFADDDLNRAVEIYCQEVNYLRNAYNILCEGVERKLAHTQLKDFGGTPDYYALYTHDNVTYLHIVDFKAGLGIPVYVDGNAQLLSYCAIVESHYPGIIDRYRCTVVQPRIESHDDVQHAEVSPAELEKFMRRVLAAMDQTHFKAGPHCQFCPVAPTCDTLAEHMLDVAKMEFDNVSITSQQIERWLELADLASVIRTNLDAIQVRLVEAAKSGVTLPGHKVIARRSNRAWSLTKSELLDALEIQGVSRELVIKEEVKSPAQVEKVRVPGASPKDMREIVAGLIKEQIVVGHKVVPESAKGIPVEFGDEFDEIED
jgi:hypothetical protein